MTYLYGFIAGWWTCTLTFCVAGAIWWIRRPINTPMAEALPLASRSPPIPLWDLIDEPKQVGRVRYEFLGLTGMEEE